MERSRKLTLTDWTKANDALNLYFEGNKSKLTKHLDMSRTTVTAFFNQKPVREAEFRKICLALRLNWQEVSTIEAIASKQEDWIEEVRSRCCQKILYQHGTIQLLNQTEIGVDQLYVDVWLLDRSPRTFQVSESKLLESFDLRKDRLGLGDRIKRNEGIEVANKTAKLLILGKPGAGKTTFLKHLAVDCCNGKFQSDLIPVLVELRKIRSTDWELLDAISDELSLDNQKTQKLLEQGKLLILMDGLDELPTSGFRRNIQEQLRNLAQKPEHSGNRFIITCRTQIIEVIPQGFTSVEVADFSDEQVEKFVKNWFHASGQTETEIEQQWKAFTDAIQNNSALKELTVTPVLLSLMCLVLQDAGELPSQATLLYRNGIRLLLEKWNSRKEIPEWEVGNEVYRKLKPEQKEALLTEIAAQKFFENPSNFVLFKQEDLAQQLTKLLNLANIREGTAVLKAIETQHGLLVERADELWSFSHLTFQEHFTIQWLTQLSTKQLSKRIANRQWQKVIMQLVKFHQPADRLVKLIKRSIDYSVLGDTKLQEFLIWVQEKANEVNAPYKTAAIRVFYFDLDRNLACDLALALDLDYNLDPNHNDNLALDLACALAIERAHAIALALVFNRALVINLDSILANKLKQLRAQLPKDFYGQNPRISQDWWIRNGQAWTKELRQVIIEHRNIRHDWQFTKSQEKILQRYYDANKFLIELLKQPGAVSDTVRQEIEDNLLLPIAELKRRLPDLYT